MNSQAPPPKLSKDPLGRVFPYLRGVAMGIPALLIGVQIAAWSAFFAFPDAIWTRADFRDIYTSGYIVRAGLAHRLYDQALQMQLQNQLVSARTSFLAFDHLAYEALLFFPFSYVPYKTAYFAFIAWNVILYGCCFWVLRERLSTVLRVWNLLPLAIFFSFLPVTITLMLGQDSILMLFLFALAAVSLDNQRDFLAGVLIGLGFFKFQIVLPIAFLFFVWNRWRIFAGISLAAAAMALVSLLLVGVQGMKSYIALLTSLSGSSSDYQYGLTTTAMPNLRGLISAVIPQTWPTATAKALTLGLSVLIMVVLGLLGKVMRRGPNAFLVAIPAAILVSYHILIQDLSMLLIPVSYTLGRFFRAADSSAKRDGALSICAAVLVVAPALLFVATKYFCLMALAVAVFTIAISNSERLAFKTRVAEGTTAMDTRHISRP